MYARTRLSSLARTLTLTVLGSAASFGQGKPPVSVVPEPYRQDFVKYVDERTLKERALNLIGLTSNHVGRSFALIAGVSKYPNLPPERQLPAAGFDIDALQIYLQKNEFFDEIVVLRDGEVTEDRLKYFLEDYFTERVKRFPHSRFLFAYSGHGFSDGSKEYPVGHLLKSNARSLDDRINSINMAVLRTYFDEVADAGYQTVALINACHSGAFLSSRPFGETAGPHAAGGIYFPTHGGAHAITAGGSNQLTWADPKIGRGSVFFEKLLAGLGGQADTYPTHPDGHRGDGIITVDEIATYLREEVTLATHGTQTPIPADLSPNRSLGGFFFLNRQKMVDAGLAPEWPPKGGTPFGSGAAGTTPDASKSVPQPQLDPNSSRLRPDGASPTASTAVLSPSAMRERGDQYSSGRGVAKDDQQARQWYEKAASAGDTTAMISLAWMYDHSLGGRQDYVQGRYWNEKAAMAGEVDAMWRIGWYLENGIGGAQDFAQARQWYKKGAEAGEVTAMRFLGVFYEAGHDLEPDYRLARQWYEKAADAGSTDAMFALAALLSGRCRYGAAKCSAGSHGVTPNYPLARQWYEKAASAGHAESMCQLGTLYEAGEGVAQDFPTARQWYEKAAEAGNSEAMRRLGWMYEIARGGTQDYSLARYWYEKAAMAGDSRSMYHFGYLCETGHGGSKDYAQAREWYEKAEKAGDPDAGKRLQQLPK